MKSLVIILLLIASLGVSASNWYFSNSGNDAGLGTISSPFATIAKHNTISVTAGDSVLFKRGDTWREFIPLFLKGGSSSARVIYGSYGTGAKPIFLGSKQENSAGDWVDQGGNKWRNSDASFTASVGNLIFNNEAFCGVKVKTLGEVTSQGKFHYDLKNKYVTLYSIGDPTTFYSNIECAIVLTILRLNDGRGYVTIDNFDVRYSASLGFNGERNNNYVTIQNCNFSYIGGGDMVENVRYGNAIQFWSNSSYILIQNNTVDNIYDAAITHQCTETNKITNVNSFIVQQNVVTNSEYGFEWIENVLAGSNNDSIIVQNNTIVNSGGGFGHNQRWDGVNGRAIQVSRIIPTTTAIYFRNNIISNATESGVNFIYSIPANVYFGHNLYNVTTVGRIAGTSYSTLDNWKTGSGIDATSISDNPLFISFADFHLQAASPARNAGIDVGLPYDENAPHIGCY